MGTQSESNGVSSDCWALDSDLRLSCAEGMKNDRQALLEELHKQTRHHHCEVTRKHVDDESFENARQG
jgi:hypothetical protein